MCWLLNCLSSYHSPHSRLVAQYLPMFITPIVFSIFTYHVITFCTTTEIKLRWTKNYANWWQFNKTSQHVRLCVCVCVCTCIGCLMSPINLYIFCDDAGRNRKSPGCWMLFTVSHLIQNFAQIHSKWNTRKVCQWKEKRSQKYS